MAEVTVVLYTDRMGWLLVSLLPKPAAMGVTHGQSSTYDNLLLVLSVGGYVVVRVTNPTAESVQKLLCADGGSRLRPILG